MGGMPRRKLLLLALGVALLLPVRAEAQSAGENQYVDPFETPQQQAPQQQQGQGQSAPTGQAQSSPSAAAPATSSSAETESGQALSETASAQASSAELPRTGRPEGWIAATGLALLALGTALRIGFRRRPVARPSPPR
jgi:LPXTG-motif cell wall-anchored protein